MYSFLSVPLDQRMLDAVLVPAQGNLWLSLDIKRAANTWMTKPKKNYGLEVMVQDVHGVYMDPNNFFVLPECPSPQGTSFTPYAFFSPTLSNILTLSKILTKPFVQYSDRPLVTKYDICSKDDISCTYVLPSYIKYGTLFLFTQKLILPFVHRQNTIKAASWGF